MKKRISILLSIALLFSVILNVYQYNDIAKITVERDTAIKTYEKAKHSREQMQKRYEDEIDRIYAEAYPERQLDFEEELALLYDDDESETVYITETGSKYHRYGCQYLRESCIAIDLSDAQNEGYTACSACW